MLLYGSGGARQSDPVPFEVISPQIATISPNPASPGDTVIITGTGFGPAQGGGAVWVGSTYGQVATWSDTQITASVAATARTGAAKVQQDGIWSNAIKLTVVLPTGSQGINIVPSLLSLVAGEIHDLQAFLPSGAAAAGLTWQVSDNTIASLSTDDPPTLTALLPGHVTITAGDASADVTVYPGPSLPIGTIKWSTPGDGSGVAQILPAVPSSTGVADVFALQSSGQLQAITADGKLAWTANVGTNPALFLIPDFQGGLITVTPQSMMRLDGMTGEPRGLYSSTSSTRDGISQVVPHTDGTIFAVDGDTLIGINPATGNPKFSIPMEHSTSDTTIINGPWGVYCPSFADSTSTHTHSDLPPAAGDLIIAGDGYAYVTYQYTIDTYTNVPCIDYSAHRVRHLRVLRVGSNGDSSKIVVKDWTMDSSWTSDISNPWVWTGGNSGMIPKVTTGTLITNSDQGVLLSWQAYCDPGDRSSDTTCFDKSNVFNLSSIVGGQVESESAVNIPNQYYPVETLLQSSDGTYFGLAYLQDPVTGAVDVPLIAFDKNANIKWSKPGGDYGPDHVASDGSLVVQSGSRGTLVSLDTSGNAILQTADLRAVSSLTGSSYQIGSVESVALLPRDLDGVSFMPVLAASLPGPNVASQTEPLNLHLKADTDSGRIGGERDIHYKLLNQHGQTPLTGPYWVFEHQTDASLADYKRFGEDGISFHEGETNAFTDDIDFGVGRPSSSSRQYFTVQSKPTPLGGKPVVVLDGCNKLWGVLDIFIGTPDVHAIDPDPRIQNLKREGYVTINQRLAPSMAQPYGNCGH